MTAMTYHYALHGPGNLHVRPDFEGLDYSDGPDAERRIREAVQAAADRSTFSEELVSAITDWPSEYHLSRQRHCLVRPLGISAGDRVLELGCGCGAITRYLGELGAYVVGVEGALARARIAAERCRDLSNVTIFAENLTQYTTGERFDWVLLVGVLEYAPLFAPGDEPLLDYLRCARAFLAPEGRLVVAIENKLGLKYFNGSAEDHLGIPFLGLQGLYRRDTPYTPGRRELEELLRAAGFAHIAFHYPFPDYKLPRVILSACGLSEPDFRAWDLLALTHARDYSGVGRCRFDEPLVQREAARNGLLGDLSNSLMAVAAHTPKEPRSGGEPARLLASSFSVQRVAGLAMETRIVKGPESISVVKIAASPGGCRTVQLAGGRVLENVAADSRYVPGELVLWRLWAARARGGGLAEIVEALAPWFGFLMTWAAPAGVTDLAKLKLPRDFLDLTPFNLIEVDGRLEPIDQEWVLDDDVPLGWVVIRSLLGTLWGVPGFEHEPVDLVDIMHALCARHGVGRAATVDIETWLACERDLQAAVGLSGLPELTLPLTSRAVLAPGP